MTLIEILDMLLLGPLRLLFEVIFQIANEITGNPALAIVVLSLAINFLVLPLYNRADAVQKQVREKERKLQRGVSHIRKHFSGELRVMTLQAYYRQNHYSPLHSLKGSVSLLLEIPFFIAAYGFLNGLDILSGVSLGPIADLSKPDGLLKLGDVSVNLLPLVMTGVNLASAVLYLRGFSFKEKLQVYLTAVVFLVLLYTSPACLVLYWTMNNLFSLGKNVVTRLPWEKWRRGKKSRETSSPEQNRSGHFVYILGALLATVLVGLLIPSTYLAASPQEYMDLSNLQSPLHYLLSTSVLAAGTFLVWMGAFYLLASPGGKRRFACAVWALCGIMLMNYMFFGTKLGVITPTLQYTGGMHFTLWQQLGNLLLVAAIGAGLYFVCAKWSEKLPYVLLTVVIAFGWMSVKNITVVAKSVGKTQQQDVGELAQIRLDKSGQNVVIIMLDRAAGHLVPYLFQEKPELLEAYDGFTYYDNVISFGGCTNLSSPSLFGGYEYTPVEMNYRKHERLVDKHNEAIKVLPAIFTQQDFDVTICDPVYANYQTIPDLSVFRDFTQANVYITEGKFTDMDTKLAVVNNNHRNFFCFSMMKTLPVILQPVVYDGGHYHQVTQPREQMTYTTQKVQGTTVAEGISSDFIDAYSVLENLSAITKVTNTGRSTYTSLSNETTHDPNLVQTPDYRPAFHVDNTLYDSQMTNRFTANGITLKMETESQFVHYHANMAAFLRLGEWLDHLRQEGVYDNTRIILVSDHSHPLYQMDELVLDDGQALEKNVERYFPLLMVKDFGSRGFTTSHSFMTLADVPLLATADVAENPVNPFTGNLLTDKEKYAHPQHIIASFDWDPEVNNGYQFLPSRWLAVSDDIWEKGNWRFLDESTVLTENVLS